MFDQRQDTTVEGVMLRSFALFAATGGVRIGTGDSQRRHVVEVVSDALAVACGCGNVRRIAFMFLHVDEVGFVSSGL